MIATKSEPEEEKTRRKKKPELKLTRRRDRMRTVGPGDRILSLTDGQKFEQYILLIQKTCSKAVFNYVVQSLFRKSVDPDVYSRAVTCVDRR